MKVKHRFLEVNHIPAEGQADTSGRAGVSLGGNLVFKDDTEELAAQTLSQPGVLHHSQLETLTPQQSVVVGVDSTAHSLDDHQVGTTLPHQHSQSLV